MSSPATPRFSVIVPTHNRLASLRRTLESLEAQTFDAGAFEVIVADDGSTDGTAEELEARARSGRLRCVRLAHRGAAVARNGAIRAARGEILAFTDDDCVVPAGWLATLEARFRETGADAIGGTAVNALPSILSQLYQDMAAYFYETQNRDPTQPGFLATNNLACRRAALDRVGPFDDRFFVGGEDRELVLRLLRRGCTVRYLPDLVVRHYHRFTLASFVNHCRRMGEGAYLIHCVIPGELGISPKRLKPRDYADFLARLVRGAPAGQGPARIAIFGLAQATMAAALVTRRLQDALRPGHRPRRASVSG